MGNKKIITKLAEHIAMFDWNEINTVAMEFLVESYSLSNDEVYRLAKSIKSSKPYKNKSINIAKEIIKRYAENLEFELVSMRRNDSNEQDNSNA